MSTTRALRLFVSRNRYPAAPRQLHTRQRSCHLERPKKDSGILNSLPIFRFFAFVGLGWGASEIVRGQRSGTALRPQSLPGPHILAQLIDNPRLPNYEKSLVRQDRAVAERELLDCYPENFIKIRMIHSRTMTVLTSHPLRLSRLQYTVSKEPTWGQAREIL